MIFDALLVLLRSSWSYKLLTNTMYIASATGYGSLSLAWSFWSLNHVGAENRSHVATKGPSPEKARFVPKDGCNSKLDLKRGAAAAVGVMGYLMVLAIYGQSTWVIFNMKAIFVYVCSYVFYLTSVPGDLSWFIYKYWESHVKTACTTAWLMSHLHVEVASSLALSI